MKPAYKLLLALLLLMLAPVFSKAQDIILTQKGGIIMAKVMEIDEDSIVYKVFDHQDGPTYRVSVSEITKIKYENGKEDVFNTKTTVKSAKSNDSFPDNHLRYGNSFLVSILNGKGEKVQDRLDQYLTGEDLRTVKTLIPIENVCRITAMVGAVPTGLGLGFLIGELANKSNIAPGLILMGAGASIMVPAMVVGIILDGKGISILNEYNRNLGYTQKMTLGATPNGIGLTFNF